jgi:hypothetical protein
MPPDSQPRKVMGGGFRSHNPTSRGGGGSGGLAPQQPTSSAAAAASAAASSGSVSGGAIVIAAAGGRVKSEQELKAELDHAKKEREYIENLSAQVILTHSNRRHRHLRHLHSPSLSFPSAPSTPSPAPSNVSWKGQSRCTPFMSWPTGSAANTSKCALRLADHAPTELFPFSSSTAQQTIQQAAPIPKIENLNVDGALFPTIHSTPLAGEAPGDGAQGSQGRRSRPCPCRPAFPPPKSLDLLAACRAALPRASLRARRAQDAEGGCRRHPHTTERISDHAEGRLIAHRRAAATAAAAPVDPSDPSCSQRRRRRPAGALRSQVPKP